MKKRRLGFATKANLGDKWYDLREDWALIESSFAKQYGIRIRNHSDMPWDEFCTLLCGLMPDTPLGQIVSIRSETDREIIKKFNSYQKQIYNDWRNRQAKKSALSKKELDNIMHNLEKEIARQFASKEV